MSIYKGGNSLKKKDTALKDRHLSKLWSKLCPYHFQEYKIYVQIDIENILHNSLIYNKINTSSVHILFNSIL
jgi:hypothetical protein